jgi:SecD/SecF fusion protein
MQTTSRTMQIIIILVLLLSAWFMYPTIYMEMLNGDEEAELLKDDPEQYEFLKKHQINLGLDLQGGMHVLLEVDLAKLYENLADNRDEAFHTALEEVATLADIEDVDFVAEFEARLAQRDVNIARYYISSERKTKDQVLTYLREQGAEAVQRAREIIGNRVNQLGLQEPIVQLQGDRRIIAELAGVTDPARVRQLLDKTALLEFRLVLDRQTAEAVALQLNKLVQEEQAAERAAEELADSLATASDKEMLAGEAEFVDADSVSSLTDLFGDEESALSEEEATQQQLFAENIFLATEMGQLIVPEINRQRALAFFDRRDVRAMITREAGEAEFLLSAEMQESPSGNYYIAYLVRRDAELTGETIEEAEGQPNPGFDISQGRFVVSLRLDDDGARIFSRVTQANLPRGEQKTQLAIVLDNQIFSAPQIIAHIRDGRAQITGMNSIEEANDLAIVLKAGALPAPVKIIEERTVGPSLGQDSVTSGTMSALIGLGLVMLFMLLYYRLPGLVADVALIFNVLIIISFMAYLNATLTLPGIAGIILTIGMAVDANVLIFERIREEQERGKSIRSAIDTGYAKAFSAILDANVTTFLAAVVLFQFGSGPVKGFAVTLMLGIVASMFTAIIVSKNILVLLVDASQTTLLKMLAAIKNASFSFIENRQKAYIISAAVIVAGLVMMGLKGGPDLAIDFKGGTIVQLEFDDPVAIADIRTALTGSEFAESEIKHFGNENRDVLLRLPVSSRGGEEVAKEIEALLRSSITDNNFIEQRVETVGPKVGTELIWSAIYAILVAMLGILIYVMFRFEFKFALGALAALAHDILITLGIFSFMGIEISITVIAAILTLIGYSLNDTIVVFDRIRENLLLVKEKSRYVEVMNRSINETLSRTFITSVTTLIVVSILAIFGGNVIFDFAFAMILGVIIGTYSSIFVASPVVAELFLRGNRKK